jgi:hypothetical protein
MQAHIQHGIMIKIAGERSSLTIISQNTLLYKTVRSISNSILVSLFLFHFRVTDWPAVKLALDLLDGMRQWLHRVELLSDLIYLLFR